MDSRRDPPASEQSIEKTPAQARGLPSGYPEFLEGLKARIRSAQVRAALSANRALIELYWDTGRAIVERQRRAGWGAGVIKRLAWDLAREFPGTKGFSARNIFRMRSFFLEYAPAAGELSRSVPETANPIVPQPAAQLPLGLDIRDKTPTFA